MLLKKISNLSKKKTSDTISEKENLCLEIRDVLTKLETTYNVFNMTDDESLIEAVIYEQNSLLSRYEYLLSRVRSLEKISL